MSLVLGPCWDATQKEEGNLRRGVFQLKSGGAATSYRSQGQPRILMSFIVLMEQMFESLGPKYVISKVPQVVLRNIDINKPHFHWKGFLKFGDNDRRVEVRWLSLSESSCGCQRLRKGAMLEYAYYESYKRLCTLDDSKLTSFQDGYECTRYTDPTVKLDIQTVRKAVFQLVFLLSVGQMCFCQRETVI